MQATGDREPRRGEYHIDVQRSAITFRTRAVFGLLRVRGTFRLGHGTIDVAERLENSSVAATISAGSFDSGNAERDAHVVSADFLDAGRHPEIVFQGTGPSRGRDDRTTLSGRLTVHGVTRPIDLVLRRLHYEGDELAAYATVRVDRYAFDVTKARGMTGRYLTMAVEVVAKRGSGTSTSRLSSAARMASWSRRS
jgi:polyisoprenoid-binding protein YceI